MDFIQQPVITSSVVGPRRSSKALPKTKLAPKKGMVTVWWSAAHMIHYSLLNPSEPLHLKSMFSKLMRCTKNCNACSWYWSTKGPNSFPQHPIACRTTLQKLNELGYKVLPPPSYSPDLSPNDYHFFKHLENFLQEKHFHNQQEAGRAFHELVES